MEQRTTRRRRTRRFVVAVAVAAFFVGGGITADRAAADPKVTYTCTTQDVRVGNGNTTYLVIPLTYCTASVTCEGSCLPDIDPMLLQGTSG